MISSFKDDFKFNCLWERVILPNAIGRTGIRASVSLALHLYTQAVTGGGPSFKMHFKFQVFGVIQVLSPARPVPDHRISDFRILKNPEAAQAASARATGTDSDSVMMMIHSHGRTSSYHNVREVNLK
jgi:hypothetical protein